jgi:hypothetical protein
VRLAELVPCRFDVVSEPREKAKLHPAYAEVVELNKDLRSQSLAVRPFPDVGWDVSQVLRCSHLSEQVVTDADCLMFVSDQRERNRKSREDRRTRLTGESRCSSSWANASGYLRKYVSSIFDRRVALLSHQQVSPFNLIAFPKDGGGAMPRWRCPKPSARINGLEHHLCAERLPLFS